MPEFEFNTIETAVESECFLCPNLIVPGVDYWMTIVTIAQKKQQFAAHQACFEFFAWSATNYIFQVSREEKAAALN
jgi:hypothetical protein